MAARRIRLSLFLGVTATMLFPVAALADAHSEIVTAGTHASLAAQGADIATVHMHLHHALNCLVGPNGSGFDAKEMNPCAQSGNGAIPDTSDAAKKKMLEDAAASAAAGIAAGDLTMAQKSATKTAATLKSAE